MSASGVDVAGAVAEEVNTGDFTPTGDWDWTGATVTGLGGGGGGVTDHGALTGLADDDHPQYHTDARGDARYQPLDTDLSAIAALTTTPFGRALLAVVDQAALTAGLTPATTSQPGIVELSTAAEAAAGAGGVVVTPDTLPARVLSKSWPAVSPGIVNTAAEETFCSFTVPAAALLAGDLLVLEYAFDLLNNSGAAVTVTWRFKLGATTVLAPAAISHAAGAARFEGGGKVTIGLPALNDQRWKIEHDSSVSAASQILLAANSLRWSGTSTEDLSTDKTLAVTAQMSAASPSADIRPIFATLTRLR